MDNPSRVATLLNELSNYLGGYLCFWLTEIYFLKKAINDVVISGLHLNKLQLSDVRYCYICNKSKTLLKTILMKRLNN